MSCVAGVVAGGVLVATPAFAADPRPDLPNGATAAIGVSSVVAGGTLSFSGAGWTAADGTGSVVGVKIDDGSVLAPDGTDIFATVTAAAGTGVFSGSVTVPSSLTGSGHWLRFLSGALRAGDTARSVHTSLFSIGAAEDPDPDPDPDPQEPVAAVTLAATTVVAGQSVVVSGSGFPVSSVVTVKLQNGAGTSSVVGSFSSDGGGVFGAQSVLIPADVVAGGYRLFFLAAGGVSVSQAITVTTTAPEDPESGSTTAAVTVLTFVAETGGLSISVAANSVTLSAAEVDSALDKLVSEGDLPTVTVADLRASDPGWSATGTVSDFTGDAGTVDGKYLGWTPSVVSTGTGQTVSAGPAVAAGTGFTSGAELASAAAGAGRGTASLTADLSLQLPTTTVPGSYEADLTLTVV